MTTNTIQYLCYGEGRHVEEACYSLLTAYRHVPPEDGRIKYVVYTDKPHLFSAMRVDTRVLTSDELTEWVGDNGYIHRCKTMAIIDALERYGGNVAFVDTDTYFRTSPVRLFARIAPGRSCLHVKEAGLLQSGVNVDRDLSDLVMSTPCLDRAGRPVVFTANEDMWNSGVVGVNAADVGLMKDALFIMDQLMRRPTKVHHVEQLVTGHCLAANRLSECRDVIFHYWPDYLKLPFRDKLDRAVSIHADLPLRERGRRVYALRPQPPFPWWLKVRVREAGRRLGFNVPGPLKSA